LVILEFPSECGQTKLLPFGGLALMGRVYIRLVDYPWLVVMCNGRTSIKNCFCGANLITKDHALTAAHCFLPKKYQKMENTSLPNVTINFGGKDLRHLFRTKKIKKVLIHRDWKIRSESYDADIAIITLNESIMFDSYVQPICLPTLANAEKDFYVGMGTIVSF